MAVSAVVQGVPCREHLHQPLMDRLADECESVQLSIDADYRGSVFGLRQALQVALSFPTDWCLIIEDDVNLCPDAVALTMALAGRTEANHAGISLFMPPKNYPETRYRAGYCALSGLSLFGPGLLLKSEVAEKYLNAESNYKGTSKDSHLISFFVIA